MQHLIRDQQTLLRNAIVNRGGYLYVSGSSKDMPTAVKEALEEVLGDKEFVDQMVKSGKYQEETWA